MKDDAKWIELQRLLYKMETHPDIIEGQSWHSLLFRAQLAQDLWHHHVAPKLTSSLEGDVDDFSQYDQLAQRVDQACRRAQELANQYEQQQQQQQSQQLSREFGEEGGVSSNNNDAEIDAVIDSLFFSQENEPQEEGSQEDGGDDDDFSDDNIVEDEDEVSSSSSQQHESEMNSPPSHQHRHHQSNNASSLEELQQAQREQMEEAISLMAKQMKDATKGIQASLQQHTHSILDELETVAEQNVQDVTQVTQNVQTHNTNRSRTNFGTWTMLFVIIGTFVFLLITIFTIPKSQNACFGPCGKFKFVSKGVSLSKSIISKSYTKSIQLYKLMTDPNNDEGEYDDEYNNEEEQMESWEEELYEEDEVEKQQKEQLDKLLKEMQNKEKEEKVAATKAKAEIPDWREAMNEDDTDEEGDGEDADDIEVDNKDGTKPQSPLKEESSIQDRRDSPNDAKVEDSSSTTIATDDNNIDERCVDTDENCELWAAQDDKGSEVYDKQQQKQQDKEEEQQQQQQQEQQQEQQHQDDVDMDSLMASLKQHAQQKDTILSQEQQEHAKQKQEGEGESSKFSGTTATSTDDSYFESASSNIPNRVGLENDEGADAFEREGVAKARVSPRDLRLAAGSGDANKLKEYIDLHPEYVNRHDKHGWTCLHLAARAGKVSIITLLLDNGADMHLQTTDGKYSYQIAAERYGRESNIVKMLRPEGVIDADDFRHAVLAGDAKKIREYTKLRPELLNLQDQNGWSPLAEAARVGNMSVVKALIQLGASKTSLTEKGQTPFDIATANFGRGHAVSYLLRPKGFIDDIDLRLAAGRGDAKKVQEYLDGGLDVNKQDNNGWASIHEAARVGSVPVLQILFDYGADKGRKTSAGETAYHIAAKNYGMDHEATRMLRPAVMSDDDVSRIEQIEESRRHSEGKRNRNMGSDEL